ncbi:MAG: STAS domain-containing protein [Candidatus Omnitrophica bacterium]|nr:STAS domain-containing protein [Candidatus Omnitrophota bacterium]MDD5671806.1 STAS domain-containing protein [Candidatus Omnitrophota bacterium]
MKINQKKQNEIELFELDGELDFHTSPELRDKFQEVFQKQLRKVVVNLKKVSYIDSSGLATFVEALQKIKRYNGKLVLTDLVPAVRSVFEIAKLDKVFSLANTEVEALQLVAQ